jgi:hypothetical protein
MAVPAGAGLSRPYDHPTINQAMQRSRAFAPMRTVHHESLA